MGATAAEGAAAARAGAAAAARVGDGLGFARALGAAFGAPEAVLFVAARSEEAGGGDDGGDSVDVPGFGGASASSVGVGAGDRAGLGAWRDALSRGERELSAGGALSLAGALAVGGVLATIGVFGLWGGRFVRLGEGAAEVRAEAGEGMGLLSSGGGGGGGAHFAAAEAEGEEGMVMVGMGEEEAAAVAVAQPAAARRQYVIATSVLPGEGAAGHVDDFNTDEDDV